MIERKKEKKYWCEKCSSKHFIDSWTGRNHFDKRSNRYDEEMEKSVLPSKITFPRYLIDDKLLIKALKSVRDDCPTIRITHAYAQIFQEGLLKVAYNKQQKLKGLKHGFG